MTYREFLQIELGDAYHKFMTNVEICWNTEGLRRYVNEILDKDVWDVDAASFMGFFSFANVEEGYYFWMDFYDEISKTHELLLKDMNV